MNDNEPAVLTLTELSRRWKCARKTVLALIHAKQLSAFRVGERAFRVSLDEVRRYETSRAA